MIINKIKKKLAKILNSYMHSKVDALVISYPKSGRTWLRVLVGKYLAIHFKLDKEVEANPDLMLNPMSLKKINKDVPPLFFSHDDMPHAKPTAEINADKSEFYNKKVVFLCRDPRDVAVSQYFSLTKRTDDGSYKGTLSDFIRDEDFGPLNHIRYLNIWAQSRSKFNKILFVTYEELHSDTSGSLKKIMQFIGVKNVSDNILKDAIAYSDFGNMQKMEREGTFSSNMLKPKDKGDTSTYKVREGKVSSYTKHLNEEDTKFLNQLIADKLDKFYNY